MIDITQHALLYDWYHPARPPVRLILPSRPSCTIDITQHALKGLKLCKLSGVLKLLPLQGALFATHKNPGRCPGLWASAPSGCVLLILSSCLQDDAAYCASWPFGCATYMGFKLPNLSSCMVDIILHALKGQKLLAQGNALGIMSASNAPCKGKSFKIHLIKMENPLRYVKLLPLQGARFATQKITQGAALG